MATTSSRRWLVLLVLPTIHQSCLRSQSSMYGVKLQRRAYSSHQVAQQICSSTPPPTASSSIRHMDLRHGQCACSQHFRGRLHHFASRSFGPSATLASACTVPIWNRMCLTYGPLRQLVCKEAAQRGCLPVQPSVTLHIAIKTRTPACRTLACISGGQTTSASAS